MANVSLQTYELKKCNRVSKPALATYLRLGFLPSPMSLQSGKYTVNSFSGDFNETFDPTSKTFQRDLYQFTGTRSGRDNTPDLQKFEALLLQSVAKCKNFGDHVFLMVSGGKDSLSIAWALHELGIKTTLIHCTNRGREDEKPDVEFAARKLGFNLIYLSDDIVEVDACLRENSKKMSLPIADAAFFAYVQATRHVKDHLDQFDPEGRAVLIDGMGNDAYMGHIPGKREKRLVRLPSLNCLSESTISRFYGNDTLHYGLETLAKERHERLYSGVGFRLPESPMLDSSRIIYQTCARDHELRRSRVRGAIFDIDCCIRKGVIAAEIDDRVNIFYPFLSSPFVDYFSKISNSAKFDFENSINKKVLREFLVNKGMSSKFASAAKGSFRFTLDKLFLIYRPNNKTIELLSSFGIKAADLGRLHQSAENNFVAAHKLAYLYCLEVFMNGHELLPQLSDDDDLSINYNY